MTILEKIVRPFAEQNFSDEVRTPLFVVPYQPPIFLTFGVGGSPKTFTASSSSDSTRYMDAKHKEQERTIQNYKITPASGDDSSAVIVGMTQKLSTKGPNAQVNKSSFSEASPGNASDGSTVTKDGAPYTKTNDGS